ncbi:hypothetical protein CEXT_143781 [Caerostris extrusa]|uniref:Uncharacterized protein n=1 Tax=Caerostris extrusa TaxID=172846 RepID=A0AAV4X1B8_CAEEX|nr:hypothetical protein CEXT_143781 [Caerostris extrusa]
MTIRIIARLHKRAGTKHVKAITQEAATGQHSATTATLVSPAPINMELNSVISNRLQKSISFEMNYFFRKCLNIIADNIKSGNKTCESHYAGGCYWPAFRNNSDSSVSSSYQHGTEFSYI